MEKNNFSVLIDSSEFGLVGDVNQYVALSHRSTYAIVLGNMRQQDCDASVEIDGKVVGVWRVEAKRTIALKRPANDPGNFTFYNLGSAEANQIGLSSGNEKSGLISVTFTPEVVRVRDSNPGIVNCSDRGMFSGSKGLIYSRGGAGGASAGGTGLSGDSGQSFTNAAPLDLDYGQQTTIHLRLVAKAKQLSPRPLTSVERATPIPPPVH